VFGRSRKRQIERELAEHGPVVRRWLYRRFGDADLAEDLVQDACLRVWEYSEHEAIDHVRALLFRTAANLAANEFRSRKRKRDAGLMSDHDDANLSLIASDAPSPERILAGREEADRSYRIILALPLVQRRAFVMSRFEGRSYREIASALDVSVSSVEKYIMSSLKALRDSLESEAAYPQPAAEDESIRRSG
jgi:RNA polymerase sigma-70 factor (ECF subfamily)